jgi:hypothetical protein
MLRGLSLHHADHRSSSNPPYSGSTCPSSYARLLNHSLDHGKAEASSFEVGVTRGNDDRQVWARFRDRCCELKASHLRHGLVSNRNPDIGMPFDQLARAVPFCFVVSDTAGSSVASPGFLPHNLSMNSSDWRAQILAGHIRDSWRKIR